MTIPSDLTGQSHTSIGDKLDQLESNNSVISYFTLNPNYDETKEGYEPEIYSWVEIPDHLWKYAIMIEHVQGYPMPSDIGFAKRRK